MADLDNLLDEIDHGHGSKNDDDRHHPPPPHNEDLVSIDSNARSSEQVSVPAALTAAAATRHLLGEESDYSGADNEGRDGDHGGSLKFPLGKTKEEDGSDSYRKRNPEYEQLKGLWTSELQCPELLPHDADTVLSVEELMKQEEVVENLLQRSKQQRQLASREGRASGEMASLAAQITKMDLDRTRFMLVDLARTRMAKIENHALHNRTLLDRLTEDEVRKSSLGSNVLC